LTGSALEMPAPAEKIVSGMGPSVRLSCRTLRLVRSLLLLGHTMPRMRAILLFGLFLLSASLLRADGPPAGASPPTLAPVVWGGSGTSFDLLKGKTVVVITYVTWCPKCNAWSGEALAGVAKAMADKPVVVLAISTDTLPTKAQLYMSQRKFVGPRVLLGYDPTIARRMGFTNQFFNYAIIGPDGKVVAAGNLGSHYEQADGKLYAVSRELGQLTEPGQFRFVKEGMSESLKEIIFPMELGTFPTPAEMTRLKRALKNDDRQAFESMLNEFLDTQLEELTRQSEGETVDKLAAIDSATFLTTTFKSTTQARQAKKVLAELNRDKDLKKELAARRLYDEGLKDAGASEKKQIELLRNVAKRFPGTHYAELATSAADDKEMPRDESPE